MVGKKLWLESLKIWLNWLLQIKYHMWYHN